MTIDASTLQLGQSSALPASPEEARLDRVGCFAYSPVEGAVANSLAPAVPDDVREERRRRLMDVQEDISAELLAANGHYARLHAMQFREDGAVDISSDNGLDQAAKQSDQ